LPTLCEDTGCTNQDILSHLRGGGEHCLQGYEVEFRRSLEQLIQRTKDPGLRDKFRDMLDCPVRDRQGGCRGFAEYILAALVKNGVHDRYDIEAALAYVAEKMLMATSASGGQRKTLFGSFEERPHDPGFNPLQARFMSFLQFAVSNINKGKIPRLSRIERRPQGSLGPDGFLAGRRWLRGRGLRQGGIGQAVALVRADSIRWTLERPSVGYPSPPAVLRPRCAIDRPGGRSSTRSR
jgi:hypothetical protein